MHCSYLDIREEIDKDPLWWDEVGVPRYCDFSPQERHSTYSGQEVVLFEIACQGCGHRFQVCMSYGPYDTMFSPFSIPSLSQQVRNGTLHYGDPPNIGCCPAGPTMNCFDIRVLEFWGRDSAIADFERRPELEIELPGAGPTNG